MSDNESSHSGKRHKSLPPELRPAFDARVLAGEDVRSLAREYGFEPWYAARRADRVLAAHQRKARPAPKPARMETLLEERGPIEAAIIVLNGLARRSHGGTYLLRGYRVGPRDVVKAANEKLRAMGERPIPYPGLATHQPTPLRPGLSS